MSNLEVIEETSQIEKSPYNTDKSYIIKESKQNQKDRKLIIENNV